MGVGKHLVLGSYYSNKSDPGKFFQFTSHDDFQCVFKHNPLFGDVEVVCASFDKLKEWKLHKGPLSVLCPPNVVSKLLPHNSTHVKNELLKAKVSAGLADAYLIHQVDEQLLAFATDPDAVFANKDFKKGELQLFPCGTVSFMKDGVEPSPHRKLVCKLKGSPGVFLVHAPKCIISQGVAKDGSIICPFFWVKPTNDEDANMQLSSFTLDSWLTIPILVNNKPIQKHSQLFMVSTSQEASVPTKSADADPPKRKAKDDVAEAKKQAKQKAKAKPKADK
jgi:hypothetical protein